MTVKIAIGVAVVLLFGMVLAPTSEAQQFLARATICVVALTAALRAGRTDRMAWGFGLTTIAVLANPILPLDLRSPLMFWVMATCLTASVAWVSLERAMATPSVARILRLLRP